MSNLHLATPDDRLQAVDEAAFSASYEAWTLRNDIDLPEEQLKLICAIWFNRGVAHIGDASNDLETETTDDDGLSEHERLGGCYCKAEI